MEKRYVRSIGAGLLFLGIILFAPAAIVNAEDGLSLVEAPQVPIDSATKAGSTLLQIKNGGQAEVSISLVVTELKSKITGQPLNAKIAFSLHQDAAGKPVFPRTLKPGNVLVLKVDVSNVTEAGDSTANIFQQGQRLGALTVVNDRAAFAVSPSTPNPDKPELTLERGSKTSLTLKNDDAASYPVSWRLLINGESCGGTVTLPAKASWPVEINPPGSWFGHWVGGIFKPDDQDGVLTLALNTGTEDGRVWPSKSVPLRVHLGYWPAWFRQFFGNLIILIVLVAGGIASLLVNAYLPNRLRSIVAEEKLSDLGKRISGISTRVDSRLRVLIRVERLRVRALLGSRGHFSPDFADALAQTNEGIAALTLRVAVAEQLDSERLRFDSLRIQLPPTILSNIDDNLQCAADLLRKTSQADLDLAKTNISKASELMSKGLDLVNRADRDDEFAKSLFNRLTYLKDGFKPYETTSDVYKKFSDYIPGSFQRLAWTVDDVNAINPRDYTAIDTDLAKLALILDYIRLYEARNRPLQQELEEGPEKRMLKLVVPTSWECIRTAQLVVRQIRCGFYEKNLIAQLPEHASIELDRQFVRVNEPIEFSVRFHHPVLDRTPAREEWSYEWTFGDGHTEHGWSAWHYYPNAKENNVEVQFRDANGQKIVDETKQEIKIKPRNVVVNSNNPDRLGHRSRVEAARLAIGLLVAIVALAAGAKEQLLKLDVLSGLLAVFVIGFAADTIKNLVTQAPAKP